MIPVPEQTLNGLAQLFGLDSTNLVKFAGGREESDGVVYAYPFQNTKRLLKIMTFPEDKGQQGIFRLEERLGLMRFMGEGGAPVVYPLVSPQSELFEVFPFEKQLWVGYTMDLAPGKTRRGDDWDPVFFKNWGRLIGLTHRLTRQYPTWEASVLPETGEKLLTWEEEWGDFFEWCQEEDVKQKWLAIYKELEELPRTRSDFGFIHNDAHIWNLLVDGSKITLLDFDVANHHWFVNDIAIACQSVLFDLTGGMNRPLYDRQKLWEFIHLFMDGYALENDLDEKWLVTLDLFIAYRRILLFIVMYNWIKSTPDRYASWKNMILTNPPVTRSPS
jgi:amicoumacin kinase